MRWVTTFFVLLFCFCVPCYASSPAPLATESNASPLLGGDHIPDYNMGNYANYVLIRRASGSYTLFAFTGSPTVAYGGYGFLNHELHFTGAYGKAFDVYTYDSGDKDWIPVKVPGLYNNYNLDNCKILMSTATITYKDGIEIYYYRFPFTITFDIQPAFSDFVQLVYRVMIALLSLIILLIIVRIVVNMLLKLKAHIIERGLV